jgi:hypothetical protein
MSPSAHEHPSDFAVSLRCSGCDARLGHDQRYCVECGKRRGPLPRQAAAAVAAILEQGRPVQTPRGPAAAAERTFELESSPFARWMPTPNTAAVAILGMLAFGVLVGSVVGTGGTSFVSSPLLLAVSPSSRLSSSTDGSGGGGSPDITVTDTSGGSAAAAALAPAAQQAATVYASSPSTGGGGNLSPAPPNLLGLPPIKHVFLIVLSNQGYSQTFGSKDKYFATTLRKQGELIQNYYAVTSGALANAVGLISGQGPTPQTAEGCPLFANVKPAAKGSFGQVVGRGCVYPSRAHTLADQLSSTKLGGWKAYVEAADQAPRGQPVTCRHPAVGGKDSEQIPRLKDPYVTWRNPFVYFHSLIDKSACKTNDVALTRLASDLKTKSKTPALSYIVPSPCDDGDPQPCAPKAAAGLVAVDKFLASVVPEIERSPAYKADGLIAITFDQAPQTGLNADPSACCDAQTFPNLPPTTTTTPTGTTTTGTTPAGTSTTGTTTTTAPAITSPTTTAPTTTTPTTTPTTPTTTTTTTPVNGGGQTTPTGGGGLVGLLLISSFVKPGSLENVDYYNHFSLLATIENIFGLAHLGYAGDISLPVMDAAVFNGHHS